MSTCRKSYSYKKIGALNEFLDPEYKHEREESLPTSST